MSSMAIHPLLVSASISSWTWGSWEKQGTYLLKYPVILLLFIDVYHSASVILPGKVSSSLKIERTWSSRVHCCYCWTSVSPPMALNASTPSTSPRHWQTTVMLLCDMWKQLITLLSIKFNLFYFDLLYLTWIIFLQFLDSSNLFFVQNWHFCIQLSQCVQSELCHRIFFVLHKVAEAGDSRLNATCAHFLRKSMRKLNRMKCILCIVTNWTVWKVVVGHVVLTCCPYGTRRWDRRRCLWVRSTLTQPERRCCGFGAVRSSTRTDLNAKTRIRWLRFALPDYCIVI